MHRVVTKLFEGIYLGSRTGFKLQIVGLVRQARCVILWRMRARGGKCHALLLLGPTDVDKSISADIGSWPISVYSLNFSVSVNRNLSI